MDKYKELIEQLRGCGAGKACKKCRREKDSLCMVHFMEEAADAIEELLKALEKSKGWTPVSEGLPDEFETLCCDNKGNMLIAHPFKCEDSDTGYSAESDECYMYNVVATWISPPKPYKEKKE